jgi:hypothetical protein
MEMGHVQIRRRCEPDGATRPLSLKQSPASPEIDPGSFRLMPILTHLTPQGIAQSIRRSGIRGITASQDRPKGVFRMPILPDYFAMHQWLCELKRRGQRTIVAVDFRLDSDEPAWVENFSRPHTETTVSRAIGILMRFVDTQG